MLIPHPSPPPYPHNLKPHHRHQLQLLSCTVHSPTQPRLSLQITINCHHNNKVLIELLRSHH
ncbi:hypothetical protein E2C01_050659 [Portunus trituberculatus]|uniref:Uncharacterized protein n=1 Tax=Portunus trituberculatus TaxID=210409 RepID=A0A5B7GJK3_PORTR|nr:hypothetical protein [Portunus trituberculatus]